MPSVGSNGVWVVEGVTDYDGDLWHVVLILELDEEGRIRRDTRYYPRADRPTGLAEAVGGTPGTRRRRP
jgi:hypothetical protein